MAKEFHKQLEEKLGEGYEVIFEIEGFQIRRVADREFIAEYDPQKNLLRAGPHVRFPNRQGEKPDKLQQEGRQRLESSLDQWREHGFEPSEEGHLMTMEAAKPGVYKSEVPRYIQPMAKHVDSLDELAEAVEWVRKHRKFD